MRTTSLLQFCTCPRQDYAPLKQQIDACARLGRSLEFRNCTLLSGCTPDSGTIGFWQDGTGYLLYIKPRITYSGHHPGAHSLFSTGQRRTQTFEELTGFLRSLTQTPPPSPAPPSNRTVSTRVSLSTGPVSGEERPAPLTGQARAVSYEQLFQAFRQVVIGQDEAVETVAFKLYAHIGKKAPSRPLSLIFHGPTGVGKSELGKSVAPVLSRLCGGPPYQFIWTELNTFTEPHSVYRLTGAPPGYVGYDDKPVFEAVLRNPKTVFMFDELDKAHPEVLKAFMSILDEGRCSARRELGTSHRELDFRQCIFLFTTNTDLSGGALRSLGFAPEPETETPPPQTGEGPDSLAERIFQANERGRRAFIRHGVLREIAGRFGGFAAFHALDEVAMLNITAKQIAALGAEYGLRITEVSLVILQAVLTQAADTGALSVRSHLSILEGCFTAFFLEHAPRFPVTPVALEGTLEKKRLVPSRASGGGFHPRRSA